MFLKAIRYGGLGFFLIDFDYTEQVSSVHRVSVLWSVCYIQPCLICLQGCEIFLT